MPTGNMPIKVTIGTLVLILGIFLMAVTLFEGKTPGYRKTITLFGLIGIALTVVGISVLAVGF
jgi:hypothetical protein